MAKDLDVLAHSDPDMPTNNMNFVQSNGTELPKKLNQKLAALMSVLDVEESDTYSDELPHGNLVQTK